MTTAVMIPPPPIDELIWWRKHAKWLARHNDPKNVRRREKYVSKAKFKPGRFVRSLNELVRQRAVYWHGNYTVAGMLKSAATKTAQAAVRAKSAR